MNAFQKKIGFLLPSILITQATGKNRQDRRAVCLYVCLPSGDEASRAHYYKFSLQNGINWKREETKCNLRIYVVATALLTTTCDRVERQTKREVTISQHWRSGSSRQQHSIRIGILQDGRTFCGAPTNTSCTKSKKVKFKKIEIEKVVCSYVRTYVHGTNSSWATGLGKREIVLKKKEKKYISHQMKSIHPSIHPFCYIK